MVINNIESCENTNVIPYRMFPFINFIDLKKHEITKEKVLVANIQIDTPDTFFTDSKPPNLTLEAEGKQKEKIFYYLKQATEKNSDLIIFPELSASKNICEEIKEKFSNSQSIIVMGSHYDEYSQNLSTILINGEWYGQIKNNPSIQERNYMRKSKDINVFINTPIGDFCVLICYDATDFTILSSIEGNTDFLICLARTQDVVTFRNIFNAITYLQYQYVIFCNDAQFGGSSFFLPLHRNRQQDTLGVQNEGVLYRQFDLMKLEKMRAVNKSDDLFKYPPASTKPRHIPYIEKTHRKLEYFKSRSFNYLSYVRNYDILNRFLAQVNVSKSLVSFGGSARALSGSIYRLEDLLLKSRRSMFAPAIRDFKLNDIVLKYFFLNLLELPRENDESAIRDNRDKIIKKLQNVKDRQYLLFELDLDRIRKSLTTTPELIDEIIRICDIEKNEKLTEIPKELQICKVEYDYMRQSCVHDKEYSRI